MRDWFVTRYPEHLWQLAVTLVIVARSVASAPVVVINDNEPDASEIVCLPLGVAYGTDPQRDVYIRSSGARLRV